MSTGFHLRCQRAELVQSLAAADAVVPSSSAKPILTNLLLVAHSDHLEIAATDLQVGLRSILSSVEVLIPGQVVVPARKLVAVLKESRSTSVELNIEENGDTIQLIINLADGSYRIPTVVGEVFPQVTAYPTEGTVVKMPGDKFSQMIKKTLFAVDRERTSAVLSGVYLSVTADAVLFAATDGKVLAEFEHNISTQVTEAEGLQTIVPANTMFHLQRVVDASGGGSVELALVGKLIFIRMYITSESSEQDLIAVELTSRCIDGTYPSYRNALPSQSSQTVTFQREELSSAVRRTALMTSLASPGIVLSFDRGEAELNNLFNNSGSAKIPLHCRYDGEAQKFGLNASYVSNVLKVLTVKEVIFELHGPGRGIITRDDESVFLIMPISIPNS